MVVVAVVVWMNVAVAGCELGGFDWRLFIKTYCKSIETAFEKLFVFSFEILV
jgi:hypothetical protein